MQNSEEPQLVSDNLVLRWKWRGAEKPEGVSWDAMKLNSLEVKILLLEIRCR